MGFIFTCHTTSLIAFMRYCRGCWLGYLKEKH